MSVSPNFRVVDYIKLMIFTDGTLVNIFSQSPQLKELTLFQVTGLGTPKYYQMLQLFMSLP